MTRKGATTIRSLRLLVAVATVAAACGAPPGASPRMQAPGDASDLVFLRTRSGITVVDGTGALRVDRPAVLAVPGSSIVVGASTGHKTPGIQTIDAVTGEVLDEIDAPHGLVPRVAARGGDLVALAHPAAYHGVLGLPTGRARTRIAVADLVSGKTRELELRGNFEPEAFSSDGRTLYLIEYLPAKNPTRYGVRGLQLRSGKVIAVGDQTKTSPGAPEEMKGTGRAQVPAPDGGNLYTLYTRQGPNTAHDAGGAHDSTDSGATHSFVHVLNLDEGWAHCVDLPHPFGEDLASSHALALTPNGQRLYVADFAAGEIAVINTRSLRVLKTATVAVTEDTPPAAAAADDLFLASGTSVSVLDGESLERRDEWDVGATVTGLAVDPDERSLYVTTEQEVVVIDIASGDVSLDFPNLGAEGIAQIDHSARI